MSMKTNDRTVSSRWLARVSRVPIFTLALSIAILYGMLQPQDARAAIGFDASSESHTGTTISTSQNSFTWTHTPVGTPRGVLVYVFTRSATDMVSSVTYGGVTMDRVAGGAAIDTATEPGRVDTFYLGVSVPTGAQSVVVNRTNNTTGMYATAVTVTAAYDTEPTGFVLLQENGTYTVQSVDDGSPGSNSLRFAGGYSGAGSALNAGTGSTALQSVIVATTCSMNLVRESTAGQGARNVGFNYITSDDRAGVHLAVRELIPTLTVGEGTNPANANAPRSTTNNALDGFTLKMNSGTGTVTGLTVTGSANFTATNIPTNGVKVWRDAGTVGVWDPADVLISTASSAIATNATTVTISSEPVTTTAQSYLVTVDMTATATLAQTFTATISNAGGTGIGTPIDSDAGSATLTVSAAQTLTVGNGTNPGNANVLTGSRNNAIDAFTLVLSAGSGSVGTLTLTGSANFTAANISGIKIYRDNGTIGTFDGADVLLLSTYTHAGSAPVVTLASPAAVTTTAANYLVLVDFSATGTDGSFTARVTAVTGTGLSSVTYSDSASATLTTKHPSGISSCDGCHGDGSYFPDAPTTRGTPDGTFVGDHDAHAVRVGAACAVCHQVPGGTDFAHRDGSIQMQATISGGSYSRVSPIAQGNPVAAPATGTCSNISCHGGNNPTPQWGVGTVGCVDCHNAVISSPVAQSLNAAVTTRRNVVQEFKNTWSHKRSTSGGVPADTIVVSADCIVCHVEGDMSTGKTNASYHANGYIDLRDPDTGSPIEDATWTNSPAGAGSYSSSGTALNSNATASNRLVRFSRNLGSSTLEMQARSIQVNQCLKCHDANGANSASAQVSGGSALNPFNVSGVSVLDVDAHFNTSNQSYHPVKGKNNNTYADNDRMAAPWNVINKTEGTFDGNEWGYLISCWDCHAPDGTASTVTLTSTVTAHGGATTLRGTAWVTGTPSSTNAVTLCVLCHAGYQTNVAGGANISHQTGSAFSSDTGRDEKVDALNYGCFYCHSSGDTAARPARAQDVHGVNGTWGGGTPQTAFIRSSSHLTLHNPKYIGATTYTNPQCTGMAGGLCGGTGPGTRNEVYTVGGRY